MPIGNLSVGAFGDEVRNVHEKLRQHGFELSAAEVERQFFGPETRDAITEFQRGHGLKVTGTMDAATDAALRGPVKRASTSNLVEPPKVVVNSNSVASSNGPAPVATGNQNGYRNGNGVVAQQERRAVSPRPSIQQQAKASDYSARDAEARVTFYVLLWKRKGITLAEFDDYWRDVHGPVCARLPGQFQYWQFHVAHNEGGIFPGVDGVNYNTAEDDQFDGIAELTFRSVADRQIWFDAASILMDDEHNIFSKAIGYVTEQGNSKTYVDGIKVGDPNGNLDVIKFHVMVRQARRVSNSEFRRYMTDTFAANVVRDENVLKFRLHLFEPPDVSRPDAAGVVHIEPEANQYQAAYEIAFENKLAMENFFASQAYAKAIGDQARYVQQVSPFPERDPYTFVYNGQMTIAGQRGSRTAELITALGATNQLRADIHELMIGTHLQSTPVVNQNATRSTPGKAATAQNGTKPNLTQIYSSYNR